jgi:hypothetical protein
VLRRRVYHERERISVGIAAGERDGQGRFLGRADVLRIGDGRAIAATEIGVAPTHQAAAIYQETIDRGGAAERALAIDHQRSQRRDETRVQRCAAIYRDATTRNPDL